MLAQCDALCSFAGFSMTPGVSSFQMHKYIWLLLDRSCRNSDWYLRSDDTRKKLDWRDEKVLNPGDYALCVAGAWFWCRKGHSCSISCSDLPVGRKMVVRYDREALVFRSPHDTVSDADSSSVSGSLASRSSTSKGRLRVSLCVCMCMWVSLTEQNDTPKDEVRKRDGHACLLSGRSAAQPTIMGSIFKTAHVVPLSRPYVVCANTIMPGSDGG